MDRRWCTPKEVAADLARAAGGMVSVDEGCLLYGERPPPPTLSHNQDADIELQFGLEAARSAAAEATSRRAPDLGGITQMLRMVQNHVSDHPRSPTTAGEVIVISKLNPNVKEFVPRHGRGTATTDVSDVERDARGPRGDVERDARGPRGDVERDARGPRGDVERDARGPRGDVERDARGPRGDVERDAREPRGDDNNNSNVSETTLADTHRAEREELEAMLKSKIQSPAPSPGQDSFHFRHQKYCAIATLLKLHSTRPPAAPIQLRTPDYFRSLTVPLQEPSPTQERATSPVEHRLRDLEANPAEVEASIHKVTNWLDSKPCVPCPAPAPPAPAPAPAPHLGPVAYKRKQQRSAGTSPSASPAHVAQGKQARAGGGAYVPSALAAELGLQYASRAERDLPIKSNNVWEKLEEDLRRKDEIIKARRAAAAAGAPQLGRL